MSTYYTCNTCKKDFYGSMFNFTKYSYCPYCWSKLTQIKEVIKNIGKVLGILVVASIVLSFIAKGRIRDSIISHVAAALDSSTLYAYSKDAYLESVIIGKQQNQYFVTVAEIPYYTSVLSQEKLDGAEALGVLPEGITVGLGTVIRRGSEVWIPASFYLQDKPWQAFALFPRDWEELLEDYDWDEGVQAIRESYQKLVTENFELTEVEPNEEKDFKERYNDYFKVSGMGDKNTVFYYAPKTDKSKIDAAYSYFLGRNNISMVLLQADTEWERPAFKLTATEIDEVETEEEQE